MKTYTFTVERHEDFGTNGFKPNWYPGEPLGGMAVAHDILEHFPHDNGTAEGEYMALGASLLIRGDYNANRNGTAEENVAADLPTIWGVQGCVRTCGVVRGGEIIDKARKAVGHFKKEFPYMGDHVPTSSDCENIARWIAKGYAKARRRYPKAWAIYWDMFKPIEEQAERYLKHAEEGMLLTVIVNFARCEVLRVECDYPPENSY